jgi:catechol 2,3-dioxygenase-like lactoylglutathione lyase family enzyme
VTVLTGIWHYSFHVSDLDASIGFYAGLLGMELVHRQEQANAYTRRLVGYPDARLLVAQLRVPVAPTGTVSSHTLELVEYVVPRPAPVPLERALPGTGHLAFAVDDIAAEHDRLRAAGVRFVSAPNAITAGVNTGGWACYFVDPDGITLELVQPPAVPPTDPAAEERS